MFRDEGLLNFRGFNHVPFTFTKRQPAADHHRLLTESIDGEGHIIVVDAADAHGPLLPSALGYFLKFYRHPQL